MSDPNFAQEAGNFAEDAAVDTSVDGFLNQGIDAIASHLPGGEMIDQMFKTEADQVVNNEVNTELSKGLGGFIQDVKGRL